MDNILGISHIICFYLKLFFLMYTDGPKLTMVKLMSFQLYHGAKVTQIQ